MTALYFLRKIQCGHAEINTIQNLIKEITPTVHQLFGDSACNSILPNKLDKIETYDKVFRTLSVCFVSLHNLYSVCSPL
jgi:hypothetical protein